MILQCSILISWQCKQDTGAKLVRTMPENSLAYAKISFPPIYTNFSVFYFPYTKLPTLRKSWQFRFIIRSIIFMLPLLSLRQSVLHSGHFRYYWNLYHNVLKDSEAIQHSSSGYYRHPWQAKVRYAFPTRQPPLCL